MSHAPAIELEPLPAAPHLGRRMHPVPIRIMHWTNAVAMFIMIGSGWKIYEDDPIFGWLQFPDFLTIGRWAQHGLQWHFFGMWLLTLNGLFYLAYGIATGRFRRMLFPLTVSGLVHDIKEALSFQLAHEDLSKYNTVQKLLYLGVIAAGVLMVTSGLAIWKPIQFDGLIALLGGFQNARLIHFLGMSAIFGFVLIHVTLALLVPKTLVAMVTGGPVVASGRADDPAPSRAEEVAHPSGTDH